MKLPLNTIQNGDCLAGMSRLPAHSVDMILCDLPYGCTDNEWDTKLPLDVLWQEYKRLSKPNAAIVLTAQVPFSIEVAQSNLKWLRYEWIWEKGNATGFLNAKKRPLRAHENVLVFCEGRPVYHPQMTPGTPYKCRQGGGSSNYRASGKRVESISAPLRYPRSVLQFSHERGLHPTQKPVALFEYLIRTYTDPGAVVLDNCMGCGTTAVACLQSRRRFIGFELNADYHAIAERRLAEYRSQVQLAA